MKTALSCLAVLCTLAACATPSKPQLPDGSERRPVNTPERIKLYRQQLEATDAANSAALLDRQRIDAPGPHLAAMRAAVRDTADTASQLIDAQTGDRQSPSGSTPRGEQVQLRSRSIVFSVRFNLGETAFNPSASLRKLVLSVAADSPRIEVRGRTDAAAPNAADQLIAERRAQRARQFLIDHGVDPTRIHVSALAAGGHVADNGTEDGRAQNRRVEIEAMDIAPRVFRSAIPIRQDVQQATQQGVQHEPD